MHSVEVVHGDSGGEVPERAAAEPRLEGRRVAGGAVAAAAWRTRSCGKKGGRRRVGCVTLWEGCRARQVGG